MNEPTEHIPLWLDGLEQAPYPALSSNLEVDVAVIGAGITGLTLALELKRAGLRVAVLEQGRVASGTSGHTTAHLTQVFDTGLVKLVKDFGPDAGRIVWDAGRIAIAHIEELVDSEHISCHFRRVPGYLYASRAQDTPQVRDEAEQAVELGYDASFVEDRPLPPMAHGACRVPDQAQFHPGLYLAALAQAVHGDGTQIFEQSHVTNVSQGAKVRADVNGFSVTADHLVYATHTPIHGPFFTTKVPAYQSYVIGAKVAKGTFPALLAWDTEDPYHYWRTEAQGDHDILIVGGEDHRTGKEDHPQQCFERLESYLKTNLGDLPFEVVYRWSGQWLEPVDGLPFIGRSHPNEYIATGFSGNGMTMGTYAALLLTDLILGREHPAAKLFDPARLDLKAGAAHFVLENAPFPVELLKGYLTPVPKAEAVELKANEGKILSLDGQKVAAYRDAQGQLSMCSAVCTHMGCLVKFNDADTTWDCPCHGSRFAIDGKVIAGPALLPLAPIEKPNK